MELADQKHVLLAKVDMIEEQPRIALNELSAVRIAKSCHFIIKFNFIKH